MRRAGEPGLAARRGTATGSARPPELGRQAVADRRVVVEDGHRDEGQRVGSDGGLSLSEHEVGGWLGGRPLRLGPALRAVGGELVCRSRPGSGAFGVERADGRRAGSPWRRGSGRSCAPGDRGDLLGGLGGHHEGDQAGRRRGGRACRPALVAAVSPGSSLRVWPIARICTFWYRKRAGWRVDLGARLALAGGARRPRSPRRSVTRMFTKSPGTSRPATPRTWSTEIVMATSLFFSSCEKVDSESCWVTNWLRDHDLVGRQVGDGDQAVDLRRVGDRGGRAELLGDLVLLDEALGEGLVAEGALRDVLDDLEDLDPLGVLVGLVLDAADVREQRVGRDGADQHGRDQDQRSTRAHTHLFSGLDLPQGRPNLSPTFSPRFGDAPRSR